jgi:hypothetical protein
MTRNEAIWLGLTFAIIEWSNVRGAFTRWSDRVGAWGIRVIPVAFFAFLVFAPWALRDWVAFGSPLPGQALTNALSLDGRDIFAWQEQPTLARYLAAGPAKLLELRVTGTIHNVVFVLLFLGSRCRSSASSACPRIAGWRRRQPVAAAPSARPFGPSAIGRPARSTPSLAPSGRPRSCRTFGRRPRSTPFDRSCSSPS